MLAFYQLTPHVTVGSVYCASETGLKKCQRLMAFGIFFGLLPAILGAAFEMLSKSGDCSSMEAAQILLVALAATQGLANSVVRNARYSYSESGCALKSERGNQCPGAPAIYK